MLIRAPHHNLPSTNRKIEESPNARIRYGFFNSLLVSRIKDLLKIHDLI